jgi:putative Holliday junction resolvase
MIQPKREDVEPPQQAAGAVLGLDIGDRRVGIAISDPRQTIAQPIATMTRSHRRNDLRYFQRLLRLRPFVQIVAGLPLYPSGDRSPQAEKAEAFARELSADLNIPLAFWDERLSTAEGHRYLDATGRSPSQRRGVIDQVAAVLILESWLAAQANKKSRQQAGSSESG